jgi:hypothetical protein
MTESEAFQKAVEIVAVQACACDPPELSTAELEGVIRDSQVGSTWLPDTYYPQGATVIPTVPNGHLYQCTVAGTSGASEPAFNQFAGTTTTDGTVTWLEVGLAGGYFDLDQATSDAWLLKAGKSAPLVQNSSAGQSLASQQLFTHCNQMARYWEPTKVS